MLNMMKSMKIYGKIRDGIMDKDFLRKHRFYDTFLHFGIDDRTISAIFRETFLETKSSISMN